VKGPAAGWEVIYFKLNFMKKSKVIVALSLMLFLLTLPTLLSDVHACRPGEVYVEGERFLGICWGRNGNECAKCVPAQK
jgi:hypothetical protein